MGLPAKESTYYTFEEYLEHSTKSEERYEYEYGKIVAMGRTADTHSEIMLNIAAALKGKIRGRKCKVYAETVSLEIAQDNCYYLPDVMLTCDERDLADRNIKRHPSLVVEVISPSSIHRDKDIKFRAYLKIPSLKYYLLITQDQIRVEVFSKTEEKGWHFNYFESLEDIIDLSAIGISLNVADIYDDIELVDFGKNS